MPRKLLSTSITRKWFLSLVLHQMHNQAGFEKLWTSTDSADYFPLFTNMRLPRHGNSSRGEHFVVFCKSVSLKHLMSWKCKTKKCNQNCISKSEFTRQKKMHLPVHEHLPVPKVAQNKYSPLSINFVSIQLLPLTNFWNKCFQYGKSDITDHHFQKGNNLVSGQVFVPIY